MDLDVEHYFSPGICSSLVVAIRIASIVFHQAVYVRLGTITNQWNSLSEKNKYDKNNGIEAYGTVATHIKVTDAF